jgi:hypothetical protein
MPHLTIQHNISAIVALSKPAGGFPYNKKHISNSSEKCKIQ